MSDQTIISQEEIDPAAVLRTVRFHDRLNPKIWDREQNMRLDVRIRLLRIAIAFYRFLDLPGLVVEDIVVTGSNAAFNYTDLSDIDIHLIVDYDKTSCRDLAAACFMAKKNLWNQTHDTVIRGHQVEMYVEDQRSPAKSNGVYSILTGSWLSKPEAKVPSWDDNAVVRKTERLADEIDALLMGEPSAEAVDELTTRLRAMRQSGLDAGGEFSVENLAYKGLRALGYLSRLYDAKTAIEDRELSLR